MVLAMPKNPSHSGQTGVFRFVSEDLIQSRTVSGLILAKRTIQPRNTYHNTHTIYTSNE